MNVRLYDAHNHLQDERLKPHIQGIIEAIEQQGVVKMVVNGSCESDWPDVLALAQKYPQVLPSFGYHPWYVNERTERWRENLVEYLDKVPSAIGEIGLDRWIENHDLPAQEETFVWQLRLAAERNLPVSIHCLQAWGRLYEILRFEPRPACGFLLHSYGGPWEMVHPFVKLGAYFSIPGYFAHERKTRHQETFRRIPLERLLIETDAPDQALPEGLNRFPLPDHSGKPVNHPANVRAIYDFVADLLCASTEDLATHIERNFQRLFGK